MTEFAISCASAGAFTMPELRQNRFTKEWVIIATERAKRPGDLKIKHEHQEERPHYSEKCPFCAGNEHMAPPEIMRMGGKEGWNVRVIPNKFAALSREVQPERIFYRSLRTMNGFGIHDVVIESPDHATSLALAPASQTRMVLQAYRKRYLEVSLDERVAHVTIFKNHGAQAGASQEHPHSQLIATPVVSLQVRQRLHEALRHHDEFGECIFCQMVQEELVEQRRLVLTSEHFVVCQQFASPTPFTTHFYPRRHMASFGDITDVELNDLAQTLHTLLAKLHIGLGDPDYNFTIRTAPAENAGVKYYHWYLSLIPRLTKVAGFELGSGMFINTVLPEDAAEFLRNINVEAEKQAAGA